MLCLLAADMNSTAGLGPVAAIGIGVTLVVLMTLLPALLVICGRWVFWPVRPTLGSAEPSATGLWARVGARIQPRPRAVWVGTSAVLLVACLGAVQPATRRASPRRTRSAAPRSPSTATRWRPSTSPPPPATPSTSSRRADTADVVATAVAANDGISDVAEPRIVDDSALIEADLADRADSDAAYDTVRTLRSELDDVGDGEALVGGNTAINLDVQTASQRDNR